MICKGRAKLLKICIETQQKITAPQNLVKVQSQDNNWTHETCQYKLQKQKEYQMLCSSTPFLHYYAIFVLGPVQLFPPSREMLKNITCLLTLPTSNWIFPSCVLPSDAAEHLLYILLQKKYCKPMTHTHLHYYDTNGCQFQVLKVGTVHTAAIQDFTPSSLTDWHPNLWRNMVSPS